MLDRGLWIPTPGQRIQSLASRRLMPKREQMTWIENQPAPSHSRAMLAESLVCLHHSCIWTECFNVAFRALPFPCCPSLTCSVWILIIPQNSFSHLVKKSLFLSFLCSPGTCSHLLTLWPCSGPCQGCLPHSPPQTLPCCSLLYLVLTSPGTVLFLFCFIIIIFLTLLASQLGG